ncbi:MAG: VWA domain-containing protein [Acidobacteriota bacterium]|nr:VWA domain-containing protein [Acidobacteriota bacterium]
MLKNFLIFIFTLAICLNVFSQTPQPTATPTKEDDIVKISTNLIQIDVTVTDNKGNVVRDLKPEDFEIYENGKKQDISNFSFISANSEAAKTKEKNDKPDKLDITPLPTKIRPEQVRRTIALVVDDLTLSFESTHFVRRALKKFVDEQMQDGDLVAIIRTGGGIGALQQFTTDKRQLYAAIEKIRWNMIGNGGAMAFAPLEASPLENAKSLGANVSDEDLENEKNRIQESNQFRENYFAVGTLGAINFTIRGMRELPGRKSVILLSDGFSLTSTNKGFTENNRVLQALRGLVDLANRSSVVVYTIDGRGLQYTGLTAADDTAGLSGQQLGEKISERSGKLLDTQAGLTYLAKQTGGFAIYNNNDISGGVGKILEDQSYYLIGYQPDDDTFNPEKRRFNNLDVKVKREGVKVRYRSGFFGVSDEQLQKPVYKTAGEQILNAISSPFAINDIKLNLNTLFRSDVKDNLFLNSYVFINAEDLSFTNEPDGSKKAVFDILAMSFGDNGVPVDRISKTYTITVKKDGIESFTKNGFVYYFTFPVKKPGAYQMRVAIRDHESEKVGSASQFVEVPKLKKDRLMLSGIVLENISFEQYQNLNQPEKAGQINSNTQNESDPLIDTALREFKKGTVLNYGFEIYNAKAEKMQKPQLEMRIRLFYNGKVIFESTDTPVNLSNQTNFDTISAAGALSLGTDMQLGDYILQIIVTDKIAKEKRHIATQFLQFEIVQ